MSDQKKQIRGTKEWAVAGVNCCQGCPNGCRYCYARYELVEKNGVTRAEDWTTCQVTEKDVIRPQPHYPGQVMFPTAHDIVPENLDASVKVIRNLLRADNQVLVVSKPHFHCINRLCKDFALDQENILFRFTITARDAKILDFWEPFAPSYIERKNCLEYAFNQGFATSVSVEPILDANDVIAMIYELLPWVNHSIWLGKMNKIDERVVCDSKETAAEVARIKAEQCDDKIVGLYHRLAGASKVRWKESIKEVMGLPLAERIGQDE